MEQTLTLFKMLSSYDTDSHAAVWALQHIRCSLKCRQHPPACLNCVHTSSRWEPCCVHSGGEYGYPEKVGGERNRKQKPDCVPGPQSIHTD